MSSRTKGCVYLVGAGPGDPSLLTLRAAKLLASADTVVHDRLIHPGVLEHARPHARLIYVGKEGGGDSVRQEDIHTLLISQARLGRAVVRLKGGDPFVFGRGGEEALALEEAGVPYEVVPGVSSIAAVPAAAAIPVTHRGLSGSVTFATAHLADDIPDWEHLARSETLVLFMAGRKLDEATRAIIAAGKPAATLTAAVEAGTWEHQRVVEGTLGDIASRVREAELGSPTLLIVGPVVSMRSRLSSLAAQAGAAQFTLPRVAEAGHE
ncbi:uroporphyrinogen-III C-methyltransferase [Hyalangium versicolor]|uniref:uroporphyrinogen-III C-methyltransferase n=1 Tax=Hyalangium versicolor TaxID=2861190 RepID=UPI001CCBCFE3|nr:uroporphyrinogen-III C-methyltransferase [Hyalangium versicolor]